MPNQLAHELRQRVNHDLAVRERLLRENKLSDGSQAEMETVYRVNAARLREIIALIGWPTRPQVGDQVSEAAWLVVQHAIGEASFMKECCQLMFKSQTEVNPQNLAYLYDRICFFDGRPQRYGTQYDDEKRAGFNGVASPMGHKADKRER